MLFSTGTRVWTTTDLTRALRQHTQAVFQLPLGVQLYRQISIAITEKHVKHILKPLNLNDDRSPSADFQGLFPDSLQPALLMVFKYASTECVSRKISYSSAMQG
jgi:hypothetical protein